MPWTFVGVSAVAETSTTTLSLTMAPGVADGDLLVACIAMRTTSTTSLSNTGWTLINEQKTNNTLTTNLAVPSAAMFYQIRAGASDISFTMPAGISVAMGRIAAYRRVKASSPLDVSTAFTTTTNITAVSGAGLTTTQGEDLIVAMVAGGQEAAWTAFDAVTDPVGASSTASQTGAPTTAWLERADSATTTGADTSLAIFDAVKTVPGATGNLIATASVNAAHAVIAAAFRTAAFGLAANTGTIALTGTATGLGATRVLSAAGGAVAFTGFDATLIQEAPAAVLDADAGAITVAPQAASLRVARVMPTATSAVAVTGVDATLRLRRVYAMIAAPGGIVLTGYAAALSLISNKAMLAAKGDIALTGAAATFQLERRLTATTGSIVVSGAAADLLVDIRVHHTLAAETSETIRLRGVAADLQHGNRQPGPIRFGRPVILLPGHW